MPVTTESTTMPVFSVLVKDTKPMWFYCATGKHCQAGMAGVINPPASDRTIAAYKLAAASVAKTGVPNTAGGTGGDTGSSTETPTTGSGDATATNGTSGSVPTTTGTNAGSTLVSSSAFALVAAGLAAFFTF